MALYFCVLGLLMLASCFELITRNTRIGIYLLWANAVVLILFSGLRWTTGTDWAAYYEYFTTLDNINSFESGYVIFTEIFKWFSDSYSLFVLLDSVIAIFLITYVIRKASAMPNTSLLVFYCSYFLVNYFGSNRRIIAIGLIFLAGYLILNHRKWWALLCILLASTFHTSSLIFVLAFFIPKGFTLNIRWVIGILLACFLLSMTNVLTQILLRIVEIFIGDSPFAGKVTNYVVNASGYNQSLLQNVLGLVKRSFWIIVLLLCKKHIYKVMAKDRFNYFYNMYFFSVCFYTLANNTIDLLKVAGIYFSIFEIILIPYILLAFRVIAERILINVVFILYFNLQFYSSLFLNPFTNLYVPYLSVFSDYERPLSAFEND